MLPQRFKLEQNRIFKCKGNFAFFTIFCVLSIFFIYSGIREYKNFLIQKEHFFNHERDKSDKLCVLYEPSPMNIFFNNSSVFENLYSTVDMTETLEVNRSYRGRNLLLKKGFFKDLAGVFFIFGSLFMVYMGMTSYKSHRYFFKFGNVFIRLGILIWLFMLLLCACYYFPKIFHLRFTAEDSMVFFFFAGYLLLFLCFFFGAGLLIRVLSGNKAVSYIYMFIFWFISTAIIPEAMIIFLQEKSRLLPPDEKYQLTKLEDVKKFKREVQKAIAGIKNQGKQKEIYREKTSDFLGTLLAKTKVGVDHIEKVIGDYEILQFIYPTGFYNYLSGEVSSKGYRGYSGFVNYSLLLYRDLAAFYLKQGGNPDKKVIVSFFKNEKRIFYAHSFLPRSFPIASGLTLLYTVILFGISYVIIKRRMSQIPDIKKPRYDFRKGNTYFVLCKNSQYRDNLFRYYLAERKNTIGIDQVKAEEVDPGVELTQIVTYFCKLSGIDEKKAWENLHLMDAADIKEKYPRRLWHREKVPDEVIYKIYCAVIMAGSHEIIFVNDFLRGKTRELERCFLDLVTRLNAADKIFVYLSDEIFLTSLPFAGSIKIDQYKSFRIDPQAVSLR